MRRVTLILLSAVTSYITYGQSPWVKDQGKGYAQISYNVISGYNFNYSNEGDPIPLPRTVTDNSIQLYGEYGLGSDWQVGVSLPYKMLSTGEMSTDFSGQSLIDEGNFNALGNIELSIKRNIINQGYLLSAQLKTELPTGSLDSETGLRSGLDALSIIPSLSIGKGWDKAYGFVSVGSAIRTNDYSGDVRVSGELGTQPIKKLWIVLVLDVVSSFENATPEISENQIQGGLYLNNQEYFAYGLKFAYEIKNGWGLNLAGYGASSGNVVARAPSVNIGVYYEW